MYLSGNVRLRRITSVEEEVVSGAEKVVRRGEAGHDSGNRNKQEADHFAAGQQRRRFD